MVQLQTFLTAASLQGDSDLSTHWAEKGVLARDGAASDLLDSRLTPGR